MFQCAVHLNVENVMFSNVESQRDSVINFLITVAKQYIYRQRCVKRTLKTTEISSIFNQCRNIEKYYYTKENLVRKFYQRWKISNNGQNISTHKGNITSVHVQK